MGGENQPLSRRKFLSLGGVVLASLALEGCLRLAGGSEPEEKTSFLPAKDEAVGNIIGKYGFREGPVREMMQGYGFHPEAYGVLGAAAGSIVRITRQGDGIGYFLGSGGLAEYRGNYFLTTVMHVFGQWLLKPDEGSIIVSFPGLSTPFSCRPTDVYSFNGSPQVGKDDPIFIKLSGPLLAEVKKLAFENKLTPLIPQTYHPPLDQDDCLFRYQGERPGIFKIASQGQDQLIKGEIFDFQIETREMVVCGGLSGCPILRRNGKNPNGQFIGVLSGRMEGEDQPDSLGLMGSACRPAGKYSSFSQAFFRSGMIRRKTMLSP